MRIEGRRKMHATQALRTAIRRWLYDPNVSLVDFGWPEREGQIVEDEPAIRVHVRQKYREGPELEAAIRRGATSARIQKQIAGFDTDVPVGAYRPHQLWGGSWTLPAANSRTQRVDPMEGGISISNALYDTYGTLGGLVVDRVTGADMILSNWHVLAGSWGASPGLRIYQPGRLDGGSRVDTVAVLSRSAMTSHHLDAAVATLTGSRLLASKQLGIGPVRGVRRFELGMEVVKSGRGSDITFGRVTTLIPGTAHLWYSGLHFAIFNVIAIDARRSWEEVSTGGDSGSWWLDRKTKEVIGLHFAGYERPERALAMDMQCVLDALGVDVFAGV